MAWDFNHGEVAMAGARFGEGDDDASVLTGGTGLAAGERERGGLVLVCGRARGCRGEAGPSWAGSASWPFSSLFFFLFFYFMKTIETF